MGSPNEGASDAPECRRDVEGDRIRKFTTEGAFLTAFGTPSDSPGHSEVAVAVDGDGTVWAANFAGNRGETWR